LKTLNWKIINNIYPTKVFLHKIGKEQNNMCSTCNDVDYIEHFFFKCRKVENMWKEVEHIIQIRYGVINKLTETDVLFGYDRTKSKDTINEIISVGKQCISKYKYGKYPNLETLLHAELRLRNLL